MTPLDYAHELIAARARATAGMWPIDYVYQAIRHIERNCSDFIESETHDCFTWDRDKDPPFVVLAANHGATVAQALIDVTAERDYWRTIAQEGVGGLPLEGENDDAI